jgi:RHS repeat-associated protein
MNPGQQRAASLDRDAGCRNLTPLASRTVIHSVEDSHGQITEDTRIAYDGLGAVLLNEQTSAYGVNVEEFRNDPLGNVLYRKTQRTAGTNDAPFTFQYSPRGELMTSFSHLSNPSGQNQLADTLEQSFLGQQLTKEDRLEQDPDDGSVSLELATRHYYGADEKLMVVQRYSWRGPLLRDGTWEEYWYDALGRRVLTRARRDPSSIYDATVSGPLCMGGIHCRSFTERVWWDADQPLVEQRTAEGTSDVSNSGIIGNIHGLTLDEPLAVMSDQTRIVNYNWRGLGESSVFPNGQAGDASLGNTATEIDWPALTQAQTYFTPGPGSGGSGNPKRWMGTFVANGQGTTGMLYRRNRYFSPVSGQFTQADPIGIAGGMNAFGFARGDPINFDDPFGLCPIEKDGIPCTFTMGLSGAAMGTIAGAIAGAEGGTFVVPVLGTLVGGGGGAVFGGAAGAIAGSFVGATRDAVSVYAALRWDDIKKRAARGAKAIALIGGILVGGDVQGISQRLLDIEKARAESVRKKEEQEKERKRKSKEGSRGSAGSDGGDGSGSGGSADAP